MSARDPRTPNLFIVGAPKSGTTSLFEQLRLHPHVGMSGPKEPHFFGRAATEQEGNRFFEARVRKPHSPEAYLSLWDGLEDRRWRGEGSTWYLYLPNAAQEIRDFSPDARVIILLRNPVELVHAMHSQWYYRSENENIRRFARAWHASSDRRRGDRVPARSFFPFGLDYRRVGRLEPPVRRFLDVFGQDRVLIMLLDDLRQDSDAFFRRVFDFLDIPPITTAMKAVNAHLDRRSMWLHRRLRHPPTWVSKIARQVPGSALRRLASALTRWNTRRRTRRPLSRRMRQRLHAEFDDDVRKLQDLLGRDLSHWLTPGT